MNLKELLDRHELNTAVIIDDGYDECPQASDLTSAEWPTFFDDLVDHERALLAEAAAKVGENGDVRKSNEYVATLWGVREQIRGEQRERVFGKYEHTLHEEQEYLKSLEAALRNLGIEPQTCGRTEAGARSEAIIFMDLFLGAEQAQLDIEASVRRVREAIQGRESNPPVVVLMSRSDRLDDKKSAFRDKVPLVAALFRVHTKAELLDGLSLQTTLKRLAVHYKDSCRLAHFLHAWETGLDEAKSRFMSDLRRLDLADYRQIQQLLLEAEGQPLGSYVLDVFDRVMQHEVERNKATIGAAEALNEIDTHAFSPPHIAGSPDLQELVHRSIFQHPERLRIRSTRDGWPVMLGDILLRRKRLGEVDKNASAEDTTDADPDEALIVLTAACDLVRPNTTKRVLLLSGKVVPFNEKAWAQPSKIKTPIVMLPTGERASIQWELKDAQMRTREELDAMLADGGTHKIPFRLRESHALELQQMFLADVGRVGVVAAMPATFVFEVAAHRLDATGALSSLVTPVLMAEGAVCFAGRGGLRLVLSERAIEELENAIRKIDATTVAKHAQDAVRVAAASSTLGVALERLTVPPFDKTGLAPIFLPKAEGAEETGDKEAKAKAKPEQVGAIGHDPQGPVGGQSAKGLAFVLVLSARVGDGVSLALPPALAALVDTATKVTSDEPEPKSNARIATFAEFWPFYLAAHRRPACRAMHLAATALLAVLLIAAAISKDIRLAFAAPVAAYGVALVGHLVVERNLPTALRHPLWALAAGFRMSSLMLRGKLWRNNVALPRNL